MDDEIEDVVGDVKYTDSQKSVATSNVYSLDFTDSCSGKNNSSSKDTYVIEWEDSEDSDAYALNGSTSVINLKDKSVTPIQVRQEVDIQCQVNNRVSRAVSTSFHNNAFLTAQEIFTQTSKTMFDAAEMDGRVNKETLETQTSFISITENKTMEYRIEISGAHKNFSRNETRNEFLELGNRYNYNCNHILTSSLENESSKFPISDTETVKTGDSSSNNSSNDRIIKIIDDESKENILSEERNELQYENTSDFEQSSDDSDVEEDSLMETFCHHRDTDHIDSPSDTSEVPQSVDNDVEELYNKLSESIDLHNLEIPWEPESKRLGTLTPLTEEATVQQDSLMDMSQNIGVPTKSDDNVLFTNNAGVKIKLLPKEKSADTFKLPPIINQSCPNSPHLNFLFSVHASNKLNKSGTLPYLVEGHKERVLDRWEIGTKDLASGESPLIRGSSDGRTNEIIHLPPIHVEGYIMHNGNKEPSEIPKDPICINEKITELKMSSKSAKHSIQNKYISCEVTDTLDEIPEVLEKFWAVITEQRIVDLMRQDFYEAVTVLLAKTGSYCRPVRKAANVALDDIVCGVEPTHAITALCIHGVGHKSALVRCASARLLVVCCALAGGGRDVLRARPPTAACARRHALRSLAALLDDKSTDTRKYAERLYSILRPLANFEAYYLTDVDVDLASRQMKKYDRLLLCGPHKETRLANTHNIDTDSCSERLPGNPHYFVSVSNYTRLYAQTVCTYGQHIPT